MLLVGNIITGGSFVVLLWFAPFFCVWLLFALTNPKLIVRVRFS